MLQTSFPVNLRLLCNYKDSISLVCRDLGINRSQFNRYLNATSSPRPNLMRKICDYFGVEIHEILLPVTDFENIIRIRSVQSDTQRQLQANYLSRLLKSGDNRIIELQGMFFEYCYSMTVPGSILCSLIVFEEQSGDIFYRRIERVGLPGKPCRRHYNYQGIALMLGDRIFLTDHECKLKLELSQTILYPDYSGRVNDLKGVKIGVAANQNRSPCCVRVYLQKIRSSDSWRNNLRRCGLFNGDTKEIPENILSTIDNRVSGPYQFLTHTNG